MVESRIELPGVSAELRRRVEVADAVLKEEGAKFKRQTVKALWAVDGSPPPDERVTLNLRLREVLMDFPVRGEDLADPKKMREAVRDYLWQFVTAFADNNLEQLGKLIEDIRAGSEQER